MRLQVRKLVLMWMLFERHFAIDFSIVRRLVAKTLKCPCLLGPGLSILDLLIAGLKMLYFEFQ